MLLVKQYIGPKMMRRFPEKSVEGCRRTRPQPLRAALWLGQQTAVPGGNLARINDQLTRTATLP
jgi:hypothetical protein